MYIWVEYNQVNLYNWVRILRLIFLVFFIEYGWFCFFSPSLFFHLAPLFVFMVFLLHPLKLAELCWIKCCFSGAIMFITSFLGQSLYPVYTFTSDLSHFKLRSWAAFVMFPFTFSPWFWTYLCIYFFHCCWFCLGLFFCFVLLHFWHITSCFPLRF